MDSQCPIARRTAGRTSSVEGSGNSFTAMDTFKFEAGNGFGFGACADATDRADGPVGLRYRRLADGHGR